MVDIVEGDITRFSVDAIVTPNNTGLQGRNPICRSIFKKAGAGFMRECVRIANSTGGCPAGEAIITNGGRLMAKKVIHAVPPVWKGGTANESQQLKQCYSNILYLADKYNCTTLALPSLGTTFYHYPESQAAQIAIDVVREWQAKGKGPKQVLFVLKSEEARKRYRSLLSPQQ